MGNIIGRTPLEWNRSDLNRLCGIFRFYHANDGDVNRAFSGSHLDIFYQPIQILASVFLAFVAFELGSGRIRIEYNDKDALNSIIVR